MTDDVRFGPVQGATPAGSPEERRPTRMDGPRWSNESIPRALVDNITKADDAKRQSMKTASGRR